MENRVNNLERDVRDHSKSISAIVVAASETDKRIDSLEEINNQRNIREARAEERDIQTAKDMAAIRKDVEGMRGSVSRVAWIIITTVAGSIVVWMLKGNLMP